MNTERTMQALSAITDEGHFERLATAILREADPIFHSLAHTGVNLAGKTVKSPLDGICFVKGSDPPHMVAVHHTITKSKDLEKKWLHDPSKAKARKRTRSSVPVGDLIKTAELARKERTHAPNLRVTLVLTSNEEPGEALVRSINAAGRDQGLEIDLWPRSRLCHFLDSKPAGQWIRYKYLGIDQELLSKELLHELSKKSLQLFNLLDNPSAWIPRGLDDELNIGFHRDVTFLVAGSGLGKSVACYRMLKAHVENGGFGMVLPDDAVASEPTLEQAVMKVLRQLHPPLASVGPSVLSFCSPERPLLFVVEDINSSGQTQLLLQKLAGWSHSLRSNDEGEALWRLVCPVWPENLASLSEQVRNRIQLLSIASAGFTEREGRDAVLARAQLSGRELSALSAAEISQKLGHDPLLIALHDQSMSPDPHLIISQFVEGSLSRASASSKDYSAADCRQALRVLAGAMLANRKIELMWREISGWSELQGEPLHIVSRLAHQGEIIRHTGPSGEQRLSFRHDRVRDWLLADAAGELDRLDILAEAVLAEPYFAEVMGSVLVWGQPKSSFLPRVAEANPLALFHSLRLFCLTDNPNQRAIVQKIKEWLDNPATHDKSNTHLRWEALAMLAETDSPVVPALVRKFKDRTGNGDLARLRNGDTSGGIELCITIEPGSGAPWRDIQIEHAKLHHRQKLIHDLNEVLGKKKLERGERIGALRLAGHIADPCLAPAIEACWTDDSDHGDLVAEYLWAFGECCGEDPARYLAPVCDAWAALSDQSGKNGLPSPRDDVAAYGLRWAFRRWPPISAIEFFIQRASQDDLRWPITYMLHGVDHPKAISFVVKELADIQRRLEGTNSFLPFGLMAKEDWRRAQENSRRPMSRASRDRLLVLWQDETNDKHLRVKAFSFWAATHDADDLDVLRNAKASDDLASQILSERLIRGDQSANLAMIEKLVTDDEKGYWWQFGRYLWSPELTKSLEEFLLRRASRAKRTWTETLGSDWIIGELMMKLPDHEAERLLLEHWAHLRYSPDFVQTALYVSTPSLLEAAKNAISECPEPEKLMEHLDQRYGIRVKGRPGITCEAQILALEPYLHLLSPMSIGALWDSCNERGWFTIRRELLDHRLRPPYLHRKWDSDYAKSELEKMVAEKRLVWIGHWIDDFLKTGVSWREILETMMMWLDEKRSIEALRFVAAAVEHRGTREDLSVLRIYEGMSDPEAGQLIADTHFAVRRQSIC